MAITMKCPRCDRVITAKDEDDLVSKVQEHVARDHDLPISHRLPRKHILARLRRADAPRHDD